MKRKTATTFSVIALICSVFPLLSFLLAALGITLSAGMQTALAGMNVSCALLGLVFSLACVRSRATRSVVNIISAVISTLWLVMIAGFLALALILSVTR